jgi:hypothetical protein
LLSLGPIGREVIILSTEDEVVLLRRHWDPDLAATEPCLCTPRCASSRIDRSMMAIARTGPESWEHVLVVLAEDGFASMERNALAILGKWPGLRGLHAVIRRQGDRKNGRLCVTVQGFFKGPLIAPRDILEACRRVLRVSADFFGRGLDEVERTDDTIIPPARSRSDKPRVAKGRKP